MIFMVYQCLSMFINVNHVTRIFPAFLYLPAWDELRYRAPLIDGEEKEVAPEAPFCVKPQLCTARAGRLCTTNMLEILSDFPEFSRLRVALFIVILTRTYYNRCACAHILMLHAYILLYPLSV